MPGITFTGPGRGDVISNPLLEDVIVIGDPDPFDLSDVPALNAKLTSGCTCDYSSVDETPLQACAHPYNYWTFLFRRKQLPQLSPISVGSDCVKLPISSIKNGIRFHAFEDSTINAQLKATKDDPMGTHTRMPTRFYPSSSSSPVSIPCSYHKRKDPATLR
jgi:hypothetical protein